VLGQCILVLPLGFSISGEDVCHTGGAADVNHVGYMTTRIVQWPGNSNTWIEGAEHLQTLIYWKIRDA